MIEDVVIKLFAQSGEVSVHTESYGFLPIHKAQRGDDTETYEAEDVYDFVEMCRARKLEPATEILKAIQARLDAMLAE